MRSQTSPKFSQCGANCQTGSRVRHEPCHTIGAASGASGIDERALPAERLEQRELAGRAVRQRHVHDGSSSPWYENVTGSAG